MRPIPPADFRSGAVRSLRAETRPFHDMVDAAYSKFDLAKSGDYGLFLLAHARASAIAEAQIGDQPMLPVWRPRTALLAADLRGLGLAMPAPLAFPPRREDAWHWGVLYVLEGSRLGATVLAKRTPAGAPAAYLSSHHEHGEWRRLLEAIDGRGDEMGHAWIDALIAGAKDTFELYLAAAQTARQ